MSFAAAPEAVPASVSVHNHSRNLPEDIEDLVAWYSSIKLEVTLPQ